MMCAFSAKKMMKTSQFICAIFVIMATIKRAMNMILYPQPDAGAADFA